MKVLFFLVCLALAGYAYAADDDLTINCPDDLDPNRLLVSHPCNCNSYFVCGTVPPTAMECPNGLQFDQKNQRCDYSWKVRCRPRPNCPRKLVEETVGVH